LRNTTTKSIFNKKYFIATEKLSILGYLIVIRKSTYK